MTANSVTRIPHLPDRLGFPGGAGCDLKTQGPIWGLPGPKRAAMSQGVIASALTWGIKAQRPAVPEGPGVRQVFAEMALGAGPPSAVLLSPPTPQAAQGTPCTLTRTSEQPPGWLPSPTRSSPHCGPPASTQMPLPTAPNYGIVCSQSHKSHRMNNTFKKCLKPNPNKVFE